MPMAGWALWRFLLYFLYDIEINISLVDGMQVKDEKSSLKKYQKLLFPYPLY